MNKIVAVLILLPTLIYGIVPWFADWNHTHLFHPQWPPHARFHMMWLLCVNSSIAAYALLLFSQNRRTETATIGLLVFGAFWIATLSQNFYGGALGDPNGGYEAIAGIDLNAFTFGICTLLLITGLVLDLRRSKPLQQL